jgi:3-methyladenine DNA glycosylase AlkC
MTEENEVANILNAAADLLETKGAWTKGAFARTKSGLGVHYKSDNACRWCVSGAIRKFANNDRATHLALACFTDYVGIGLASFWNDYQPSSEPVIAALRGAANAHEA